MSRSCRLLRSIWLSGKKLWCRNRVAQAASIFRQTYGAQVLAQQLDVPLQVGKLAVCPILRGQGLAHSAFGVLAARDVTNTLLQSWLGFSHAQSLETSVMRAHAVCMYGIGTFENRLKPFADAQAKGSLRHDARWAHLRSDDVFSVSPMLHNVWKGLEGAKRRGARSLPVLESYLLTMELHQWSKIADKVQAMPFDARRKCTERICGLIWSFGGVWRSSLSELARERSYAYRMLDVDAVADVSL